MQIILDFGPFTLDAELFNSTIASNFAKSLPYTINLEKWGNEVYGSVGMDLSEENPIPTIPSGGLAYSKTGSYLCIFFGQTPAWPVEYIGQISGDSWKKLLGINTYSTVTIRLKH
ncbi:MAG: hypothetical protein HOD85_20620 [Deltaproteobacteria bacterium]|nr:hypothetical protein [Deltaproteobacteria bacterium]